MSLAGGRLIVLVNPSARRSGERAWRAAVRILETACRVDVAVPASAEAMARAAREAVRDRAAGVVVVGGDGSVNCVANELAAQTDAAGAESPRAQGGRCGPATALGMLPIGTGNDFARAMGIAPAPEGAARQIITGCTKLVDLGRVGQRRFCTAGLLGVPSDTAMTVRRWLSRGTRTRPLLHLLGEASYSLSGARHLLFRRRTVERYRIEFDEGAPGAAGDGRRRIDVRGHGVFFANTAVLGGGLTLPIGSDAADGVMEIAVIPEMPRWKLLWAFVCLTRGWPVPPWALRTWRARAAVVTCDGRRRFSADGDLMDEADRFSVTVEPLALRVFCGDAAGDLRPQ